MESICIISILLIASAALYLFARMVGGFVGKLNNRNEPRIKWRIKNFKTKKK